MSSLLLDSHALLWYDTEPSKLSKKAANAIRSVNARIFVSAASIYELAYKVEKQKLPHAQELIRQLDARLRTYDFEILPISSKHAMSAAQLQWDHRDPFDRIIAAQAIEEKLTLVTMDGVFDEVVKVKKLW